MCGIIGLKLFNETVKDFHLKAVENGLEKQRHRGPDAKGIYQGENVVLGHNRLSIIDKKSRSNQPMTDESKRYQLVFNGEIYNYPELKNRLLQLGYKFKTSSDTEVLLYFLIEYGVEKIEQLNGCFAFAFFDTIEDELTIARDKLGINPLLFGLTEEGVYFASEMWFFSEFKEFKTLNQQAISEYFQFSYIAAPNTIIKDVQKLLPGHYLKVKGKFCDIKKYWSVDKNKVELPNSEEKLVKETKSVIEDAVIKRLVADVPIGTFLSGGIDSSIVSAIVADFKDNLNTFSVGFIDNPFKDESKYAQEVAKHIGSLHHPIMLSSKDVMSELPDVLNAMDEPFGDSSAIAMYFLAQRTKEHVTVSLSGDGADELFGGYNKHLAYLKSKNVNRFQKIALNALGKLGKGHRRSKYGDILRKINKFNDLSALSETEKYWFLASFVDKKAQQELLKNYKTREEGIFKQKSASIDDFLILDQQYVLQGDMLKKVDLMSMRHSLEVRTPFLDENVVEFANNLPSNFKSDGKTGKIILRKSFREILPESVFNRSKQGFEVPLKYWLLESWSNIVDENWFNEEYIVEQDIFNAKFVEKLKRQFFEKDPNDYTTLIWLYIVFQHWYSKWMIKK